jgi:adenosylcobinamide-GDP ribazoletransferase
MGCWRDFVRAATFLTRIPFQIDEIEAARPLATAALGFPLVGLMVGVIGAIAFMIANAVGLPQLASALIAVAATALVAGGLHEEGLANTVDGLSGGKNRDDSLHIMREAPLGKFGMLALIFVVGLKVAAIEALGSGLAAASLIAAEVAGRTVLPVILMLIPPARTEGLSFEAGRPRKENVTLSLLLGGALTLLMLGIGAGFVAIIITAALCALMVRIATMRLGGYTGDVLGAIEQLTATVVLLTAAAVV